MFNCRVSLKFTNKKRLLRKKPGANPRKSFKLINWMLLYLDHNNIINECKTYLNFLITNFI